MLVSFLKFCFSSPFQLNILACGIVGSYSVVLAIACYVYTSLAYIALDLLRRLLNDYFSRAYTNVPFQTNGECCFFTSFKRKSWKYLLENCTIAFVNSKC